MTTDRALEGRKVLLTGALGSLGRAQADLCLMAGARVFLLDRPDHPAADETVGHLEDIYGKRVAYLGLDLADLEGCKRAIGEKAAAIGGFDVLINNAALILNRPFEDFSLSEYSEQMTVNAGAAFALTQAVAPAMKSQRAGNIVNLCSITLNGQWEGYVPYIASKGAIVGLTRSLARELGLFGIRVNAVSPGAVVSEAETRVFGDRAESYEAWILAHQSLKRRIKPEDIAATVVFLASDAAAMISGQVLNVDGGW